MNCCIQDLCEKDVINVKNGCRLGPVCDVEVDTCTGKIVALIIFGRGRLGGLGARDEIKVRWDDIQVIGDDTILVCSDDCVHERPGKNPKKGFEGLFR